MAKGESRFDDMMGMPKETQLDRIDEQKARKSFEYDLGKGVTSGVLSELLTRILLEARDNAESPMKGVFLAKKIEELLREMQDTPEAWKITSDGGGIYIKKGVGDRASIAYTEIQEALGADWMDRVNDEKPDDAAEVKEAA